MTLVSLAAFIEVTKPLGGQPNISGTVFTTNKFQNGKYNEIVDGHTYLSFLYLAKKKILAAETWLATLFNYDPVQIELVLSSAIDAVGANAPTKTLTSKDVGHLPVTGNIQAR